MYKLLIKHNQIELVNDDFTRYTLMMFTGNELIRKNVVGINEVGKAVKTNVFYVKVLILGQDLYRRLFRENLRNGLHYNSILLGVTTLIAYIRHFQHLSFHFIHCL